MHHRLCYNRGKKDEEVVFTISGVLISVDLFKPFTIDP